MSATPPVIDASRRQILGIDPRDGSALPPVPASSADEVAAAVARSREGQATWQRLSPADRAGLLKRARARFIERSAQLVEVLRQENGKPEAEAYISEIVPNIGLFDYWLSEGVAILKPRPVSLSPLEYPKKRGRILLEPRGVIGLISPWNYPLSIPLRTILPALMAGNGVVFKPSEYAPRVGREIAALFDGVLPEGLFGLVQGGGEIGAALCDHVDHVVFTGSVATGKKVAERAAARLIPASLELGGKDAAIVLEDADIERAAQGISWAAFANAGQNCAAVERVYVVRAVAQPFLDRVTEIAKNLRVGQDVGPLTNPGQRAIVESHLSDAKTAGAEIRAGGDRAPGGGLHIKPAVVVLPERETALERDETFGPVLPIRVVADEAEAVGRANASRYGLTASVWTRDLERGERVAARLKVGTVTVNNHAFTAALPMAPWSGVGESGSGVTNSPRALEEMCRPKFILVDGSNDNRELWWYPYNETLVDIAKALVERARGGLSGVVGMGKALRLLPRRFKRG
jgi:acyl-CoA reductase-like NAD-dependent aldehyde dehydrogenase